MANEVIGSVKSCLQNDSNKDIMQAVYKVLNSWTLMEEKTK